MMKLYRVIIDDEYTTYPLNILNDMNLADFNGFDNFTEQNLIKILNSYIDDLSNDRRIPILEHYKKGMSWDEIVKKHKNEFYIPDRAKTIIHQRVKTALTTMKKRFEKEFIKTNPKGNARIYDLNMPIGAKRTLAVLFGYSAYSDKPDITIEEVLKKYPSIDDLMSAVYNLKGYRVLGAKGLNELITAFHNAGYNYPKHRD